MSLVVHAMFYFIRLSETNLHPNRLIFNSLDMDKLTYRCPFPEMSLFLKMIHSLRKKTIINVLIRWNLPGYDPPCDKDPHVSFVDRHFSVPPVLHAHSDGSHSSDESEAQEEPPPPQASSSAPDSGSVMLRRSSRKSILPVDYETSTT